jgi:hypothetical protein
MFRKILTGLALTTALAAQAQENHSLQINTTKPNKGQTEEVRISDYTIQGFVYLEGNPSHGDTVTIYNEAHTDSVQTITDENGFYRTENGITGVSDTLENIVSIHAYPNPGVGAIDIHTDPSKNHSDYKLKIYDIRGREIQPNQPQPEGIYIARLTENGKQILTKKIILASGTRLENIRITYSNENPTLQETEKRLEETTVEIKARSPGYITQSIIIEVGEGINTAPDINLEEETQEYTRIHGRTGNEIGNLIAGGTWNFRNQATGETYTANIDPEGYWTTSIPDTIPTNRNFTVWFSNNPEFRPGTFTFLKPEEPSATGTEFTNVDIFPGQTNYATTTKDVLTRTQGHLALTFSTTSADNDTIVAMIRNPWNNKGVVKNTNPNRDLYSRLDVYTPGNPEITPQRREIQMNTLEFVETIRELPGDISHPYYMGTTITEGFGLPAEPSLKWRVYQREDVGAGNSRSPPGATYMTGGSGYTRGSDPINTLILEITEAHLGLNDYTSGSNHHAFAFDEQSNITGLNHIGQVVSAVANTYLPEDFKRPSN